jgi:predicted nucleic acid-binding protein
VPSCTAVVERSAVDGIRAYRPGSSATWRASETPNSVALTCPVYLLDTNIVSELRKRRPNPKVVAWVQDVEDPDLHLSAVTIGEIQAGIEVTRSQDPTKAVELEAWVDQLADSFNVLAMDAACFRRWAKLMHRQSSTVYEDAMIAPSSGVDRGPSLTPSGLTCPAASERADCNSPAMSISLSGRSARRIDR